MPDGLTIAEFSVAALLVFACLPLVWVVVRRLWLSNRGWVFVCSLKRDATPGTRWVLGVARLKGGTFEWYRMLSLSWAPSLRITRRTTRVRGTRSLESCDQRGMLDPQAREVELATPAGPIWLSMSPASCTALLSWVEAAPPGVDY